MKHADTSAHAFPIGIIGKADGDVKRLVIVGDSINDILAAKNAAVPSIGVTFCYSDVPMAQLEPDVVIDDFAALTPDLVGRLLIGCNAAT